MSVPIALTIAASDLSGARYRSGPEIFFRARGPWRLRRSAVTAQNTKGVFAIHDVPADVIAAQIDAVFADLDVGAVKIGMLATELAIDAVAAALDRYRPRNVVLDPVMIASSGERLLREDGSALCAACSAHARHHAESPEAAALLDAPPARDEAECAAKRRNCSRAAPARC